MPKAGQHKDNMPPQPSLQADTGKGLRDSLDSINQLNQALIEQQEILDNTLKLRAYQAKLNTNRHQKEREVSETKMHICTPTIKRCGDWIFSRVFPMTSCLIS